MKKITLFMLISIALCSNNTLMAQWLLGGNNLAANSSFGSNTNFSVIFETNNIERGRMTNTGLWGFGTAAPTSKVHINSIAGQSPFQVQVNGLTKLLVHPGGGTSIGALATPPVNGLFVSGNTGIGTTTPEGNLHIFRGSAGVVAANANAPLVIENAFNNYINLLTPNAIERGILFGDNLNPQDGGIIYVGNTNSMQFRTNGNATRMTLTAGGNLGIGTTAPSTKLQVLGGLDASPAGGGFIISGPVNGANIVLDENEIMARNNGVASNLFLNHNGSHLIINGTNAIGNVGIGTTAPANRLHVKQNIANSAIQWQHETTADFWTVGIGTNTLNCRFQFNGIGKAQISSVDGTYSTLSDERMKKDIEPVVQILDKVMELKPSKYFYKDSPSTVKNKSLGLIAQEVEKIFPELVHIEDGGYKWLNYSEFGVLAIKAIQEQQATIQGQQQIISSLEDRIAMLEAAVSKLGNNKAISSEPTGISLDQNHPNPFNQTTTFRYKIPAGANAYILVYDATGKLVKSIQAPASGQAHLNASDLGAGTYTYTLKVNGQSLISKKMILSK